MKEYKINIDIFYQQFKDINAVYRIYVDDDLITERTYIWVNATGPNMSGRYIRENIWVNLRTGEHELRIESPDKVQFSMSNLKIDNQPMVFTTPYRFIISE
jgi:hypothetical protein